MRNVTAFNYLKPNTSIPSKIAHYAQADIISDLHERHNIKQQQFFIEKKEKESEKRNKKSKKDKHKKQVRSDRILVSSNKEQPAQRFNIPPHHEYQNINEEQEKHLQLSESKFSIMRKFGDTGKLFEKKTRCFVQDGVYLFHSNTSNTSSLTSFAEIENKKNSLTTSAKFDVKSNGKLKNFNLSKYLNIDMKPSSNSPKVESEKQDHSSKSSSLSNKSIDSERAIIMNGLKNSDSQTNSYLGPFNFRKLLRPTGNAPTESLRKRKLVVRNNSSPPPDKNLKTN